MAWFDDPSFWDTFFPYIFSEERLCHAADEAGRVLALASLSTPDVLDLCCGTGRHAVAFAHLGCRVTGVDRTSSAIETARATVARSGVEVELIQEDMREFVRPGAFDLVVNLFTSFGYFESVEEEERVLRNVHASLRPGGTFVVDVMGKEVLARIFQDTRSATLPDGTLLVWRTAVAADWTRLEGNWYAVRAGGTAKHFHVDHWIYSGRELRDLLRGAGFSDVRLFGDLDGRPYDLNALRLVAVARR